MAQEMMEHTLERCIWLTEDSACELMRSCRCHSQNCSFRRTEAQRQKDDADWRMRMLSLPEEQQRCIAKKYYGGNMPWKTAK